MTNLRIQIVPPEGSRAFADLAPHVKGEAEIVGAAIYPEGTSGGLHAIGFFVKTPTGDIWHAQLTQDILRGVVAALEGSIQRQADAPPKLIQ